jgi:D-psicose/D-tagatose/L-ribulose 3-epimerase
MGLATFLAPSTSKGFLIESLPLQDRLERIPSMMDAFEKNGFDFVEAEVALLSPEGNPQDFETFKKKVRPFSIKPEVFSAFIPPDLKVVGPQVDETRLKRYLEVSISRVAEVGGKVIIWGSGSSRTYPKNYLLENAYKQIEGFLHLASGFARENGIYLAIEHMNKGASNTINSLKEALVLREKVNLEEIQVMLDFDHLMLEEEEFSSIEACQERVIHVHISDRDRRCPGDGDYPFDSLFKTLKRIDYQGRISLECNFQQIENESKRGLSFVKRIWEKAR